MDKLKFLKLLVTVFLCNLMLAGWITSAFADETDVTVDVDGVVRCLFATQSDAETDWSSLTEIHIVDIGAGYDELSATFVEYYCGDQGSNSSDYSGYLHWEANCEWTCRLSVGTASTAWSAEGLSLHVKTGTESTWTPLSSTPASYGVSNGNARGCHDVDWRVEGLSIDMPPTPTNDADYYSIVATFSSTAN